jgi:cytochrome c peroxidase
VTDHRERWRGIHGAQLPSWDGRPRTPNTDRRVLRWAAPAILLVCVLLGGLASTSSARDSDAEKSGRSAVLAPAWRPLEYEAPKAGTYDLPALGRAADGPVLDISGTPRRLHDFLGDKLVVLSFIYTSCPDMNACPMATYVLQQLQTRIRTDASLRDEVRLVTMSFDPTHDSPEVMHTYAGRVARPGADWQFLTTTSEESLAPILRAYGQSVKRDVDAAGNPLRTISHILRVFLIDRDKRIRNIYTTSFLHPETVASDIHTLLLQEPHDASGGPKVAVALTSAALHGPGDNKHGYEGTDYTTRSANLPDRQGRVADLLAFVRQPPRGLPAVPVPPDNALTPAKVSLGRKLFFDRRMSRNDTISCAMCHVPEQGFSSNEMATAVGIEGRTVRRNAPTVYNVAYAERLFHDGREDRLEQQIWGPLLAANEMGNPSVGHVLDKIRQLPDYAGLFEAAFVGRGPTMETLGSALASYERTLVSGNSPFDRWYFGGEEAALSPAAIRGFTLFRDRARCVSCHHVGETTALFTDQALHNTGIGYRRSMKHADDDLRVQVAPGTFLTIDPAVVAAASEPLANDLGRYEITGRPEDRWKYKTPSLRNVALTSPYMHDGSLRTLREVVAFYNRGGVPNEGLDPAIHPLGLTEPEVDDLVAFLESLTGDNVAVLVNDAFAVPIGDPG